MNSDRARRVDRAKRQAWDVDVRNYVKKHTPPMTGDEVQKALEFTQREMEHRKYAKEQIELIRLHWEAILDGDDDILDQIASL